MAVAISELESCTEHESNTRNDHSSKRTIVRICPNRWCPSSSSLLHKTSDLLSPPESTFSSSLHQKLRASLLHHLPLLRSCITGSSVVSPPLLLHSSPLLQQSSDSIFPLHRSRISLRLLLFSSSSSSCLTFSPEASVQSQPDDNLSFSFSPIAVAASISFSPPNRFVSSAQPPRRNSRSISSPPCSTVFAVLLCHRNQLSVAGISFPSPESKTRRRPAQKSDMCVLV